MSNTLTELDNTMKKAKEYYDFCEKEFFKAEKQYLKTINSKLTSKERKIIVHYQKCAEVRYMERLSSELLTINYLRILAGNIEILKINVKIVQIQLKESGIFEKAEQIGDIVELKAKIKKTAEQLHEFFETKKKLEESNKENLSYIG